MGKRASPTSCGSSARNGGAIDLTALARTVLIARLIVLENAAPHATALAAVADAYCARPRQSGPDLHAPLRALRAPFKKDRRRPGGLCSAEAIDRAPKNINFAPESS